MSIDIATNGASLHPSRPNLLSLRHLENMHVDHDFEGLGENHESIHSLLDNLCIKPRSLAVTLPSGISFPLFAITLHTGFKRRPLQFLRLGAHWEMWPLRRQAPHRSPRYSEVSPLQVGFLDEGHSWIENHGHMFQNLPELHHVTKVDLRVFIDCYGEPSQKWLVLCALPSVTSCWITSGEELLDEDLTSHCNNLLSVLDPQHPAAANNANDSERRIRCPFPQLDVLGIGDPSFDQIRVLPKLVETLTHREEVGYRKLRVLSLPYFSRPNEDHSTANVAAALELRAETIYWGRECRVEAGLVEIYSEGDSDEGDSDEGDSDEGDGDEGDSDEGDSDEGDSDGSDG
ncbi:unnamed protein product [Peniophora sp. CBMAI 1063]|nr:unnamed protein product [Peniophora sp. CBMAI 1063]